MTDSSPKYNLNINKSQARVLIAALDLYSRIGLGQFEEVVNVHDLALKLSVVTREGMRNGLNFVKQLAGHPPNGSYGIHNENVDDVFRVAFDLKQVIRNRLAWDQNPKGDIGRVDFDEPRATSKEPLAKIAQETKTPLEECESLGNEVKTMVIAAHRSKD